MQQKLTITAISGWAIPNNWYEKELQKAFPNSKIHVVYPENPEDEEEANFLLNKYPSKLFIGYSLGSLWLLKYQKYLPQNCHKAILAPILSFLDKNNLGGKTSETQLKYLIKILSRNQNQRDILKDFFYHANLPYPETKIDAIPDRKTLIKGLEFLINNVASGSDTKEFFSIIGNNDIFINAEILKKHIPHLIILKGVGHAPAELLMHLAKTIKIN